MSSPPTDPFLDATRALLQALVQSAEGDPVRRAALAELANWLRREVEDRAPTHGTPPKLDPRIDDEEERRRVEARPLSIGGRTVVVAARVGETPADIRVPLSPDGRVILQPEAERASPAARMPSRPEPRDEEEWPGALERARLRARLKADACAWLRADDATAEKQRETLQTRARELGNCFLWPLDGSRFLPPDADLERCAEGYGNLALLVDLLLETRTWTTGAIAPPEELLYLAAEVQSALRAALLEVGVHDDSDQIEVFIWIRELGARHSIFVPRYLRREDRADPSDWRARRDRIRELAERLRGGEDDRRERKRLIDKLNYQCSRLSRVVGERDLTAAWTDALRTLDAWVSGGRPPSSREIVDPLLPHLDLLPDDLEIPPAARRVLLAADDWLATRSASTPAPSIPTPPSQAVLEARKLLADKIAVLIGGERRVDVEERLQRELGLAELRWRSTRAHRSIDPLIEQITRPEVDLVIVAIRWSDHAFGDLRTIAESAGKPFITLPAGYGTNQVAHHVLSQASGKLGGVVR